MLCLEVRCPNPGQKVYFTSKVPVHLMRKHWMLRWKFATTAEPRDGQVSHYEMAKRNCVQTPGFCMSWGMCLRSTITCFCETGSESSALLSACGVPRSESSANLLCVFYCGQSVVENNINLMSRSRPLTFPLHVLNMRLHSHALHGLWNLTVSWWFMYSLGKVGDTRRFKISWLEVGLELSSPIFWVISQWFSAKSHS